MKKKVFGIVLLVLAALVLLQGNFGIPSFGGQILALDWYWIFCLSISWSFASSPLHFSLFYSPSGPIDCQSFLCYSTYFQSVAILGGSSNRARS